MFTARDIIDLAVQVEKNAEQIYRRASHEGSQPALLQMLQWLADEEARHARWFAGLKPKLDASGADPRAEEMGRALLRDVLGSQSFSLADADITAMDRVEQLISAAVEFEKDKVIFYQMLRPFVEEKDALDLLEKIIAGENRHIRQLRAYGRQRRGKQVETPETSTLIDRK